MEGTRAACAAVFESDDLLPIVLAQGCAYGRKKTHDELKGRLLFLFRTICVNHRWANVASAGLAQLVLKIRYELKHHERWAHRHLATWNTFLKNQVTHPMYAVESSIPHDDRIPTWHRQPKFEKWGAYFRVFFGVPYHDMNIGSEGALEQHLAIFQPQTALQMMRVLCGMSWCSALDARAGPLLGAWYEHPYEWLESFAPGRYPNNVRFKGVDPIHLPAGKWLPYTHEDDIVEVYVSRELDDEEPEGGIFWMRPQVDDAPREIDWYVIDLFAHMRDSTKEEFTRCVKRMFERRDAVIVKLQEGPNGRPRVIPKKERFVIRVPVEPFGVPMLNKECTAPLADTCICDIFDLPVAVARSIAAEGMRKRKEPKAVARLLPNRILHRRRHT